jgi:RAMP superfamily
MRTERDEQRAQRIADILRRAGVTGRDREFIEALRDAMVDVDADPDDDPQVAAYADRVRALLGAARSPEPPRRGPPSRRPAGRRPPPEPNDLSAPYRFVSLNETVAFAEPEVVRCGLDVPLPGGFCGLIEVTWAAETPILIGARRRAGQDNPEVDGPVRLGPNGPYVIPGATIRGLLRATCEIIAHGRLSQVNRHHRYAVRDFTHPLFAGEDRPTWDTLHSGWLRRRQASDGEAPPGCSDHVLTPCQKHLIRIRSLPDRFNGGQPTGNGSFHRDWLNKGLMQRYEAAGQVVQAGRRPVFDFATASRQHRFVLDPLHAEHVVPDPAGPISGFFVFAGRSPTLRGVDPAKLDEQERQPRQGDQKKREYIFVDDPAVRPVPVTEDAFRRFELAHTKPSRNKREPDGSYETLHPTLAAGGRIPVFYIGDLAEQDGNFSIGLTRLFKRGHRWSVADKLAKETTHALSGPTGFRPDMVEALFGYVYEPDELGLDPAASTPPGDTARKARAAFGFATLQGGAREAAPLSTVMMAPRASYAPFYLRGACKDWSDDGARLAGRKRYFPRFPAAAAPEAGRGAARTEVYSLLRSWTGNANRETQSHLVYLEPTTEAAELTFCGTIRLHNVSAVEIGMLLLVLTHGGDPPKPYRHMIGGRPPAPARCESRHSTSP